MTQLTVRPDLTASIIAACGVAGLPTPTRTSTLAGLIEWTPDLSAADLATLASLQKLAIGATLLTKAERDFLEGDINTLRLYDNAASPTNAQTVAAVKAIIHVLRAFVRD
jgi:hypothetical protein